METLFDFIPVHGNYSDSEIHLDNQTRFYWSSENVLVTPILAIVTLILLFDTVKKDKNVELYNLPPGRSGWPILGETIEFIIDGRKYFRSRLEKHGKIFRTHLMGNPAVVVVGAANVKKILTAPESHIGQNLPPAALSILGQRALCAVSGPDHRRLQRAVLKVFTHRNLSGMTSGIQNIVRKYINQWTNSSADVMCAKECRQMTFEVANYTLLGFDFSETDHKRLMDYFDAISDAFFSFPINIPGTAFYKGMTARNKLTQMILEKRSDENGRSLLDRLFADKTTSQEEITSVAMELMFGGNQTIASAVCAALITLPKFPKVLAKMRQEVHDYCERYRVSVNNFTFKDVQSLTYIGDVVRELLRVKAPIAGGFRKTLEPIQLEDYTIPKGFTVLYGITDTHETTDMFAETELFRPERWAESRDALRKNTDGEKYNQESTHRFDYLPFGGGKRFCVGKELAKLVLNVFLIELSVSCDWELGNGEPKIRSAPIPFPCDGLPIKFTPADKSSCHEHSEH